MGNESSILLNNQIEKYNLKYNWIPSLNVILKEHFILDTPFKYNIDLRNKIPFIPKISESQVISIISTTIHYYLLQLNINFIPSINYLQNIINIYYNNDKRQSFQDIFKIIQKFGVCSESDFNYNIQKLNDTLFIKSYKFSNIKFVPIFPTIDNIKLHLSNNRILLLGVVIYKEFLETKNNPSLKFKKINISFEKYEDTSIGGLAGIIVGYKEKERMFIIMTSNGSNWGDNSCIYMPYSYLENFKSEIYYIHIPEKRSEYKINMEKNNYLEIF